MVLSYRIHPLYIHLSLRNAFELKCSNAVVDESEIAVAIVLAGPLEAGTKGFLPSPTGIQASTS